MARKLYSDSVEKMARACQGEQDSGRRGRELANYLLRRMEESDREAGRDNPLVIYISLQESAKDPNHYSEAFLMASLLYLLFSFKFLRVSFVALADPPPKARSNEFQMRLSITGRLDDRLASSFYESVEDLMRESYLQLRDQSMHFSQLSLGCLTQIIDPHPLRTQLEIIRKREDCYKFIYKFYDHLQDILADRKAFITKSTLDFGCFNENSLSLQEVSDQIVGTEVCMRKIVGLQGKMHSNILVIKAGMESYLEPYFAEENREASEESLKEQAEFEEQERQMGFYAPFKGNPFEYLSRFFLSLSSPPDFKAINGLLSKLPNIANFKIAKQQGGITVPHINELIATIIAHNKIMELFWLSNIQVVSVSPALLQQLYVECPYLCEFQIGLQFRHLIEETFASSSPQEKQLKDSERESQLILNALRLRKISLYHNLQMSKLLIKKGYNFNAIIQVIDCIEPFCF